MLSSRRMLVISSQKPNIGIVRVHFFGQQFSVFRRMPGEEGTAEASAESRLRFRYTHFSTGYLGRVAADEMIHGLFGR